MFSLLGLELEANFFKIGDPYAMLEIRVRFVYKGWNDKG